MGPAARPPLTRRRVAAETVCVVLAALALSGALVLLGDPDLHGDQNTYNLLVAKKLAPELFARDALYRYEPDRLHVPWFLATQAALARRLGGDVERALAWLGWLMGALFVVGHYVFFRVVTGRPLPAALASLGAMTLRNALGGEVWGFDGLPSAATRTILAGLTPPLLLLFVWWRSRPALAGYWALLGVLFNVHPVTAYQLAEVTALAHLWRERCRPRALGQVALGMALFVVAALPYLVPFLGAQQGGGEPAMVRAALDYRFPYLLYPIAPNALLSVAFHLALPFGAWLVWRRHADNAVLSPLEPVMVAAVAVAFGGTALIQAHGVLLNRPYLDIQQLRALRLLYPILLGGLALTYARLLERRTARARTVVGVLLVLSLIPPAQIIHAFSWQTRATVKYALGMGAPPVATAADTGVRPALWQWVRTATPPSALFMTDDAEFRLRTRRSITGSYKDGALMFLAGSGPLAQWYTLDRQRVACRASARAGCWFELGRRLDADYVVVDPGLAGAASAPPADFEPVWREGSWSVWRRRSAA